MISVIVPVYNVEPYLHRCVDSILAQTFTDFDLILVDDGSPDNCPAICDEYAEKDSRVHVIHQENGGLSAARNAGIDWAFANSDSQWLTFVDSDDWIHPEMLERLLNAAQGNGVGISMCYLEDVYEETIPCPLSIKKAELVKVDNIYAEQYSSAVVACCKLYRKDLFETVRYPVGKINEDLYTTYKLIFQAPYIAVIKSNLYYYYRRTDSITLSSWSPHKIDIIQAHESAIAFFKKNKYLKAEERQINEYIKSLASQICIINNQKEKEYKPVGKKLQKKLKKMIWCQHALTKQDISGKEWILETAFPHYMRFYWIIKAILKRFKS